MGKNINKKLNRRDEKAKAFTAIDGCSHRLFH